MEIKAEYLRQRYSTMETEELIELKRNGGLTEVASGVLDEILKTRGVTDENQADITKQLKEKISRSKEKRVFQDAYVWFSNKRLLGQSLNRWLIIFIVILICNVYFIHPQKTNRSYLKEVIENGTIEKAAVAYIDAMKKAKMENKTLPTSSINDAELERIKKGLSECMSKEANNYLEGSDPYLDAKADKETPRILLERFLKACE